MNEVIAITRVFEIRESFEPSGPLSELLGELLASSLSEEDRARIQGAILFRSYRRRLMTQGEFISHELHSGGDLRKAMKAFKFEADPEKPHVIMESKHIPLENIAIQPGAEHSAYDRILIQTAASKIAIASAQILSGIPTIESNPESRPRSEYWQEARIRKGQLVPEGTSRNRALSDVKMKLQSDIILSNSSRYYVEPKQIIHSETAVSLNTVLPQYRNLGL